MEYSYKFRIEPNAKQKQQIQKTFGCCRFVFNHFLAERMEQYKQTGKAPTRFQQEKDMTALKKRIGMAAGSRFYRFAVLSGQSGCRLPEFLSACETRWKSWLSTVQKQKEP